MVINLGINRENWSPIILALFIIYFLLSDYGLYEEIQNESKSNITVTVKAFMLDHVNAYILQPLTENFVKITNLPNWFPWIQADHVSYCGLIFAFIASRLVLSDSLHVRRFGVIAFFGRQFMDDLDGYVARYQMGIDAKKQVSLPNSMGYIVDGICDAIGTVVFLYAVFRFSYNRHISNKSYTLLNNIQHSNHHQNRSSIIKYYWLLLLQIALASLFWNMFLNKYHEILDPSIAAGFSVRTQKQEEIFKSSLMFIIMWLWRCLNPHALTNYLLISIWLDKATQFAKQSSQYVFYMIISLSFLCSIHLNYIKYRLTDIHPTLTV